MLTPHHPQSGRSMVEMLGTLAIVGVLSVGAIGGYSYAMNKHRTNELIYEATKRAQWVGTQLEMNNPNPSLNTFGNDSFGGGSFTGEVKTGLANPNQFGIAVSELKEGVCKNIIKGLETETNGVIRAVLTADGTSDFNRNNCADDAAFLLVFNRDLSANDTPISGSDPEVSGEASGQATGTAPEATETTELAGDKECNYHGMWMPTTGGAGECYCNYGWDGDTCSEDLRAPCNYQGIVCGGHCNCDSGWGGSDCLEDKTNACNGHGYWQQYMNDYSGGCYCNDNWAGNDCSEDHRNDCSGHGTWKIWINDYTGGCECNPGWAGADCSINTSCSGHGWWTGSYCSCNENWGGNDCSEDKSNACSGNGTWHSDWNNGAGDCSCQYGWGGTDCSQSCGHGWRCGSGCNCDSGWYGPFCHTQNAANACNEHGSWNSSLNNGRGGCECNGSWGGADCSIENACSGNGYWNGYAQRCFCNDGWGDDDCSKSGRETYCNNHGTFIVDTSKPNGGFCDCDAGYTGTDCSTSFRAIYCNDHGTFIVDTSKPSGGFCDCDSGYTGSDCSTPN